VKRNVKCKKCGRRFLMDELLAHRLLSAKCDNAPRCPRCELRAKAHTARVLRAYRLFIEMMATEPAGAR